MTADVGRLAEISDCQIKIGSMGGTESSSGISAAHFRVYFLGNANRRLVNVGLILAFGKLRLLDGRSKSSTEASMSRVCLGAGSSAS